MPVAQLLRGTVLAGSITLTACGGAGPTSPTGPQPQPEPLRLSLTPGEYLLGIVLSTSGSPRCENGVCVTVSLCLGGSTSAASELRVIVDRQMDDIAVRAADPAASFRMALRANGNTVAGTAAGAATGSNGLRISVGGSPGGEAVVAGSPSPTTAISGSLDGSLSIGGANCSNNGHTWSLTANPKE